MCESGSSQSREGRARGRVISRKLAGNLEILIVNSCDLQKLFGKPAASFCWKKQIISTYRETHFRLWKRSRERTLKYVHILAQVHIRDEGLGEAIQAKKDRISEFSGRRFCMCVSGQMKKMHVVETVRHLRCERYCYLEKGCFSIFRNESAVLWCNRKIQLVVRRLAHPLYVATDDSCVV